MIRTWTIVALSAIPLLSVAGAAQAPAKTVKDGVYTPAQAVRGEEAYRSDCASCHGADLKGSGQAPSLVGEEFITAWKGPLFDLFDRMQATMPADRPGQLPPARTADILAFVLEASDFPAGAVELPSDEAALKAIQLDAR